MDGILVVDKPQGMTSHDVVNILRKRFGLKKVGHAGTLDPMATGVLIMLIGRCTKLSGSLVSEEKEYEATLTLGGRSDTADAWGKITPGEKKTSFTDREIKDAFGSFEGEIEQLAPMYSAVKVGGKRLYKLARKGIKVDVPLRKVVVKKIDVTGISLPEVSFRVVCSKGTYIRQLCADIGEALGCGAYLSRLVRRRSGSFTVEQAVSVDDARGMGKEELAKRLVLP